MPETIELDPAPTHAERYSPEHLAKVRENGKAGGSQAGVKHRDKVVLPTEEERDAAIEIAANHAVSGRSPRSAEGLRPINEMDRAQLARFTCMSVEEFNTRLAAKLRVLADMTAGRIYEKLAEDKFKPHELSFLMTVGVDKLDRLQGRSQINAAQVNVQINNFGPQTKEQIIARLTGQSFDPLPVKVEPAQAPEPEYIPPATDPEPTTGPEQDTPSP